MRTQTRIFFITIVFFFAHSALYAQIDTGDPFSPSAAAKLIQPDTKEFPQWAKDLRRADIIMFGVFPFAWLFSSIALDLYRSYYHHWDSRYYPWPATSPNAVGWTNDEYVQAFCISGAVAITIALTDFIIIKVKRSKAQARARALAPDDPEIKRTPIGGNSSAAPPPDSVSKKETKPAGGR